MEKPRLIILTGCPGAGKTTLATRLSTLLGFVLLSRDAFKQGLLESRRQSHAEAGDDINQVATDLFFKEASKRLITREPLIIEAAFQQPLWLKWLGEHAWQANVRVVLCEVATELAWLRFQQRRAADPGRAYFHGDGQDSEQFIQQYALPDLPFKTLIVDTTDGYQPGLEQIADFCR